MHLGHARRVVTARFRCPRCRRTATVQPADVVAGLQHDLPTIAGIISEYLAQPGGYRELPLRVLGIAVPADLTPSTVWGHPEAPSPTPSTCFRWVARFVGGALAWWRVAAQHLLRRGTRVPVTAPPHLAAKGRGDAKRQHLRRGWLAARAYQHLAGALGLPADRWPLVLRHDPVPPPGRDATGWFCRPPP
jgi:hypothetical protein